MGVKDLWSVLTPHAERKPMCELRGKTVAIDLAGWVCESLNVVDYFVHPRHHLKNLFFRTCYLIWEEVTPVFVLEGVAPKLKSQVIAKRNELQFRGVKPKENTASQSQLNAGGSQATKDKGRTRFNHVLKQCETLLQSMGIKCVQGPGEAEAYCAFLNKNGLVDGVISQDSDCFAYGAVLVYRNFSVSTQGAQAAQGGAVDIYDMRQICQKMDFGQHKIIVMALLCGCDYCPDGIGGVGRDGVLKLFNRYTEKNIMQRIKSWRSEDAKYTSLEMRVDDKTICSNCGHLGRTQSHTKSGCGVCRTNRGCDESLWKEERLSLKAELMLRKKALGHPTFPCEEIIQEFLTDPPKIPDLNLSWKQPNIVKFIKQIGNLLQWTEIYCFQKFFPILTRWQVRNAQKGNTGTSVAYVEPQQIVKKRTVKGVPSLELIWQDERGSLSGLIPDEQLSEYEKENPKGLLELWSTVEPLNLVEVAYPEMVKTFMKSKEKTKKPKKVNKAKQKTNDMPLGSLENLKDLIAVTDDIAKSMKTKRAPAKSTKKNDVQLIDKFFKKNVETKLQQNTPKKYEKTAALHATQCSTPNTKYLPTDIESDCDDDAAFDMSDIINGIVKSTAAPAIVKHAGRLLHYEPITKDLSLLLKEKSLDDLDLMAHKRNLSISFSNENTSQVKRLSLDDSFDILVNTKNQRLQHLMENANKLTECTDLALNTHIERFKQQNRISLSNRSSTFASTSSPCSKSLEAQNVSYFFNSNASNGGESSEDAFEQLMELSFSKKSLSENCADDDDVLIISDNSDDE